LGDDESYWRSVEMENGDSETRRCDDDDDEMNHCLCGDDDDDCDDDRGRMIEMVAIE
jgi:hypothetical protein